MPEDRSEISHVGSVADSRAAGQTSPRNWLGWTVALIVLVACVLFLDVDTILATVRKMKAREVALVLVLLTCDRILMALKWRLLLGIGGAHLPALSVIRIYYQCWLVGAVLPSHVGGDILRAHLVRGGRAWLIRCSPRSSWSGSSGWSLRSTGRSWAAASCSLARA